MARPAQLSSHALLPEDGLLQHEDEDARWYIRVDGAFFQARPGEPYPVAPTRHLNGEQMLRLRGALYRANLARLARFRWDEPPGPGAVWSVPGGVVAVREDDVEPLSISLLRATVERVLLQAVNIR